MYETNSQIRQYAVDNGYNYKIFIVKATCVALFYNEDIVIIAISGSTSNNKWYSANFITISTYTEGRIHRGFASIAEQIEHRVKRYIPENRRIILCGHSLGGAVATILASRFKASELYTFGSPRVGNATFVASLKTRHYRMVNANDIVPNLPSHTIGYRHHGKLVYFNYYGDVRKLTLFQKIKDHIRGRIRAFVKDETYESTFDHSIDHYKKKIINVL